MHAITVIFFRWLHVFAACLLVGGAFFLRLLVLKGMKNFDVQDRKDAFHRIRRAFKMIAHTCILFLLVSGIYNTIGNWPAYNQIPAQAHPLWGIQVLLGVLIICISFYVLADDETPKYHANWMIVNLLLMALALRAAAALKYVRDNRPPVSAPQRQILPQQPS